ncbi:MULTISPECIES: iron ABC transporter permease [unclassified Rhodococcus (in: high G+C Gram-positive bacteria)]|uniref:ABC transporter permease n=1 Tax=unclassified Rhodococcus (in: high G+C Gram-positive bacteria) TaxID=192944 RepID=UPI00163B5BD6|nr:MULTISPECIES: iron ABC transporter permease [unclassified Rhodococcus (in: high G+C Gram-positive bacteria)]MBC2641218.1 iron ABC transporter permease [Rhodococcus sp. 3A]MBC2894036.1 iron ABC transporter permease [Rhodococcus sp. 4CII]
MPFPLAAVAVIVVAAALLPLGYVIAASIDTGWDTASALLFRPRVRELLQNTVMLVVVTVPICVVVGVAAAWLVERTRLFGAKAWAVLLAAPLAVPAFVNSYSWVTAVPSLGGLFGGVLIATLSYFPLVYIPAAATLRRLDPAVEESARALGAGPVVVFCRVVVPQLRLAIAGGALLVSLHLLAEYGAFVFIRFDTFTTAIFEQYQSTFNGSAATMLAGVLVLLCLTLLVIESVVRGSARYARIGSGAARRAVPAELGWRYSPIALLFLGMLIAASVGVPLVSVARWLVIGGSAVWKLDAVSAALGQTLGFGIAGAVVTCVLAFPIAWISIRHRGRLSRVLEGGTYISSSLPGIVVALAFVTVTIRYLHPLYQTVTVVIAAYALLFLPRALVNLRAGLAQAPVGLEETAQSLGVSPWAAFVRVTLRLAAPATAAGGALVFLGIVNELTATLLLAPTGTRTLSMQFWSLSSEIDYAGAAPYALIMIVMSLPMTYVLFTQSKKVAGL